MPVMPAAIGRRRAYRLALTPSTRVLWRGPDRLQLELGSRAVVVDGLDAATVSELVHGDAQSSAENRDVFDVLHRAGFLTRLQPPRADPDAAGSVTTASTTTASVTSALLAPDLAALGARFGERAADVLTARGQRRVAVHGGGRLPALIGSLLAAAGVGYVHVSEFGDVRLRDAIPGGLCADDEGARMAVAVSAAIRRAAPAVNSSSSSSQPADLVVVTTGAPVPRPLAVSFAHAGQPHLVTGVWGAAAVVGPLVVPGRTSCLQCADLQRRDRDPAWPALAAQLAASPRDRAPSDVCICSLAAAVTALQCLSFLDGELPATIEGTLELALPDWRLRRRSWPIHPDCRCASSLAG